MTKYLQINKGRVILLDGRRLDFETAETRPPDNRLGLPAHLRITYKDGMIRMLFWGAIVEIVQDGGGT